MYHCILQEKVPGVKFSLGGAYTDGNGLQRGGENMSESEVLVDLEDLLSYEGDGLPSDR